MERKTYGKALIAICALLLINFASSLFAQNFYWESPVRITMGDARFPCVVSNAKSSYVFWQEVQTASETIWLSCQYLDEDNHWQTNSRFAGPFPYSGEVPDIYSAAVSSNGTIAVAVLSDVMKLSVFVSTDGARNFKSFEIASDSQPFIAPRIYATLRGSFMLFVSVGQSDSFNMRIAFSDDGKMWTPFSRFAGDSGLTNSFVPVLVSSDEGETVIFQAQYITGSRISYQLYETFSADGGRTWSRPVLLTDARSLPPNSTHEFSQYHNQRPFLYSFNGSMYLAWERTLYTSENAHICMAVLSRNGLVQGSMEQITREGNAKRAVIFSFNNLLSLAWFDNRSGIDTVYMAQKRGALWNETKLSSGQRANLFAFPIIARNSAHREDLSFVWQELAAPVQSRGQSASVPAIYRLEPDTSVARPSIAPVSFVQGKRSSAERARFRVSLPNDSSGIAGFSWSWSQDNAVEPPLQLMNLPSERVVEVKAEREGIWFFKVRAADYAGNWSLSSDVQYYLDLTPPQKPVIVSPPIDKFGFVNSNTFNIHWQHAEIDDDIAGYTWNLQYVASVDERITVRNRHPILLDDDAVKAIVSSIAVSHAVALENADALPRRILGVAESVSYANRRNGIYVFSVAAIDSVGNIGEASSVLLILNKYVPATYISAVERSSDIFGNLTLSITGGGFTYDGTINTIFIDADGVAPYDLTIRREDGSFRVLSDNRIADIKLGSELQEGTYRIGLVHSDRGLHMSDAMIRIEKNGTVKIEKQYVYVPSWKPVETQEGHRIHLGTILLWAIFLLAFVVLAFTVAGLVQTAKSAATVRSEIKALIIGDVMPQEKKKKTVQLRQKGVSLKFKLMGLASLLVVMIVILVSVPLGISMVRTQEQTLAHGLFERIDILLDSLTASTRIYMPSQNLLELNYLPDRKSAIDEAEYVTITGYPSNNSNTSLAYVWATNDVDISQKINNVSLSYGESKIIDETIIQITDYCESLNDLAVESAGTIAQDITELNAEGIALALRTDSRSVARREEIAEITTQLSTKLTALLNDISLQGRGSVPEYNNVRLDRGNTSYLFYRPVLYRQGSSQEYVRGIVFVKVSTEKLIASVDEAQRGIVITTIIIALIAVSIGAVSSFIMASVIVSPIRKLAQLVKTIGDTTDKTKLAGKDIEIKHHDEIGQLGESVNEMTRGLVKAAQDEKLLMDGKVVQQTFLPLYTGSDGVKETVARLNEDNVQCFGYYEGASGVSGDYFDYKKLDNRWYVLIKCDASGHGVPAALLMTVVATLFRKYFESWSYEKDGTRINNLIVQINDFIESLGIKGKFAAIIICLFDTQTGDVYMCNAGDNIVHIYDSVAQKEKMLTLVETPAAGPLPSFMVDMRGGFKVERTTLKKGDVLFLYTDGIEEATRKFRDASFAVVKCMQYGMQEGAAHGNHKVGEESEQLESARVAAIIESVFSRKKYVLEKYHNPVPAEVLEFDFSQCNGTIEDAILALVSIEKVFRMYKPLDVSAADVVRVDKKIDAFLQTCFNRYDYYCSAKQPSTEGENYLEYAFLREDEQLDDLTLLAVRRP